MSLGKCELCNTTNVEIERHHTIPQKILKEYGKMQGHGKYIVRICHSCHQRLHNFLLEHLINGHRDGRMSAFAAMRYYVMKKYLKAYHPDALKGFESFFKEFITACMNDLDCETQDSIQSKDEQPITK